mgnify:CR=1 FL=1
MRYEVTLPPLGEDAGDEATVSYWLVGEGEAVNEGDDLLEMVTDKAIFNVPSPRTGRILEHRVRDNDIVLVGQVLAIMEVGENGGNTEEQPGK